MSELARIAYNQGVDADLFRLRFGIPPLQQFFHSVKTLRLKVEP